VTSKDPDRQFARGNPWARAVRPPSDDEKANSPILYVAVGLLSLVLVVVFIAALVLPPMFMHTLILRGVRAHRPGMLAAGVLVAAIYFMFLWAAGKRLMAPRQAPPERDDAGGSGEGGRDGAGGGGDVGR